jgi:hypothetical protein
MWIYERSIWMQKTNPKGELPAMKEHAAKDKDEEARQKSIDKERKGRAARYEPIADNEGADGRAQNRPVALEVSNAPANFSHVKDGASDASVYGAKESMPPYKKK